MKSTKNNPDIGALMEVGGQIFAAFQAFRDLFELQNKRARVAGRYDSRVHVLGGALQAELSALMRIIATRDRWKRRIRRAQDLEVEPRLPGAVHPVFGPVTQDLLDEQAAIRRAIDAVELLAEFEAETEMIEPAVRQEVHDVTGRIDRMLKRWAAMPDAETSRSERDEAATRVAAVQLSSA